MPLKHPVNIAYEAATVDLEDTNAIDPFHLEAYGKTATNYNRDIESFPVLQEMMTRIMGTCPYKSPTDMGVNMVGRAIVDNSVVCNACVIYIFIRNKKSAYYRYCDSLFGHCDICINVLFRLFAQHYDVRCACIRDWDARR